MTERHKVILEEANAALLSGDIEGFLSACTDDTVWTFVGDQVLRGKEAVRQYLTLTYKEPPPFTVERMIAEGDFLTLMGEITLKDEQGRPIPYAACDVWRFENSKMAELRAYVIPIPEDGAPMQTV